MATEVRRDGNVFTVTASSTAGTTAGVIPYTNYAAGLICVSATQGATQINWYAAFTAGDTGRQVYDNGAPVTTAVTVGCHPIPDSLFSARYVIPVALGATTGLSITVGVKG